MAKRILESSLVRLDSIVSVSFTLEQHMHSSGLQRRRGAKPAAGETFTPSVAATNDIAFDSNRAPAHKVGCDSRDIANESEAKLPLLTLMEEVLLMGLKDREGYLSFWNDNISYTLRGCILLELALRNRIALVNDPARRRFELSERLIEVIDTTPTGEVLLDETIMIIKRDPSNLLVSNWIDLLSGETWNLLKINCQLKQVRERLAKGLVDKGVLRTERKSFFLFDMATHPIADKLSKEHIKNRIIAMLTLHTIDLDALATDQSVKSTLMRYLRSVALVCGSYAANVLENVLTGLNYDKRDQAFARADEILSDFGGFPFNLSSQSPLGVGSNLGEEISAEVAATGISELQLELLAAVISVFSRMDSIL